MPHEVENFWPVPTSLPRNVLLTVQFWGTCWFRHNKQMQRLIHVSNWKLAGYSHINDALFSFYLELLWIWILRNVQNCSGVIKKKLNFWKFLTDFVLKLTLLRATCGGKFKLLTKTSPKTNKNWGNFWTEKWYVFLRKDTDWRYF